MEKGMVMERRAGPHEMKRGRETRRMNAIRTGVDRELWTVDTWETGRTSHMGKVKRKIWGPLMIDRNKEIWGTLVIKKAKLRTGVIPMKGDGGKTIGQEIVVGVGRKRKTWTTIVKEVIGGAKIQQETGQIWEFSMLKWKGLEE